MPELKDGTISRVGESVSLVAKTLKSSVGGVDTYTNNTLNHVNPQITDLAAYTVAEGWANLTDNPPEDIILKRTYSIHYED